MSEYYDRAGNPITVQRARELFSDSTYSVLHEDRHTDGSVIRTVWTGVSPLPDVDKNWIFETHIEFADHPRHIVERYSTESEAEHAHANVVRIARIGSRLRARLADNQ